MNKYIASFVISAFFMALIFLFAVDAIPRVNPNIVVIMTDDQDDASLEVMTKTKNLLVDRGIRFLNSFVDYSLCCPSRATLMTGQNAHNHGVYNNKPPEGGYNKFRPSEGSSLPVWLKHAGYDTAMIGKYLNGYWPPSDGRPTPLPGWDRLVPFLENCYFNCSYGDNGSVVNFGSSDYSTDVIANKAVEFVMSRANLQKPFFMWVTPIAPHGSVGGGTGRPEAAPRHRGLFASLLLPKPPSFNEADVSDKPFNIRSLPPLDQAKIDSITAVFRARWETILAVDEMVEKIVNALGKAGKLENTVIVFTSDNGWLQGEHRISMGKKIMYEESARVPLVMKGPGIPAGQIRTQLVNNVDLSATILDLAGATPGRALDGKSVAPLFHNPTTAWRTALLIQAMYNEGIQSRFKAVRTNRFLFAEHMYSDGSASEKELFDLATDPYELQSRHSDSVYASVMASLQNILSKMKTCAGSSCWITDPEPTFPDH